MIEQLKEMNAELEAFKKQHLEKAKSMFSNIVNQLFEKHAVLESFGWRQYTPYFNDGDECTFSAHTDEPDINGMDAYSDGLYDKISDYLGKPRDPEKYDNDLDAAVKDVRELLSNIDDSVYREMFGDHVEVTVSRNGTSVEEYRHD